MDTKSNRNNHQHHSQVNHSNKSKDSDDLLNLYNLGLEDETWQRIVRALAARGFPVKEEDLQLGKR